MAPPRFVPSNIEPSRNAPVLNQPVQPPNIPEEINSPIDDLVEVPSKRFV
jgi:hypothetical protein